MAAPCRTTHTAVSPLSAHRDRPQCRPRQYRVTAGQRCPSYRRATSTRTFEILVCRLFRDRVQFCSGLVDLIECVGCHGGVGHAFPGAGEGFVGLVVENVAQVGDGRGDLGGGLPFDEWKGPVCRASSP